MISVLLGFTLPSYEAIQSRSYWIDGGRVEGNVQWYVQLLGFRLDVLWLP